MISNLHDEAMAIRAYFDKRAVSLELPPYITLAKADYHAIPPHIAAAENAAVSK